MDRNSSQNNKRSATTFVEDKQLVVFKLENEEFGVSIEQVREIVRVPEITHLPRAPEFLRGISNLRGDIMPIIDTRKRFSMPEIGISDRTRVLVVDADGLTSGLIVDEVNEVMRVSRDNIERPPTAVKGIKTHFLEGVVKIESGKRVIMTLNLNEALSTDIKAKKSSSMKSHGDIKREESIDTIEEEQIISLKIGNEEYGFAISKVREILRFSQVTRVPNVPKYVKGLITVRNKLLPILDMRTMLGKSTWLGEVLKILTSKKQKCDTLINSLASMFETNVRTVSTFGSDECEFGRWLSSPERLPGSIIDSLKELRSTHDEVHESAKTSMDLLGVSPKQAREYYEEHTLKQKEALENNINNLISRLEDILKEEQRIVVIEARGVTLGLLVDTVNEVVRVPKTAIEDVSIIGSTTSKEVQGVAKLNNGQRLIMIMNESSIISNNDLNLLETLGKDKPPESGSVEEPESTHGKHQINGEQNEEFELLMQLNCESTSNANINNSKADRGIGNVDLDEVQLVTFNLGEEEFGLKITDVQEINRLEEITKLPKAPEFLEGVTNLRGNVIPVIDLRKRLSMPLIDRDDRTRIIISDIGGRKTGFIVDKVNEVLRISKKNIENANKLATGMLDSNFVEGLGKINEQRIVILLNIEKILTKGEVSMLEGIEEEKKKPKPKKKKKSSQASTKKAQRRVVKNEENRRTNL